MRKKIEGRVKRLNAKWPVGSKFYYHPVSGELAARFEPVLVTTRTKFQPNGSWDAVWVWLLEKVGPFDAILARLRDLERQVSNVKSNIEFRKDMVREALEKTTHAAKVEIMSSIQLACNTLGLHALKDKFKLGSGTALSVELEE